jgi:gluconolactonase
VEVSSIADNLGFTEGPVWLPDGSVACASITEAAVFVIGPDGTRRRIATGGGPNGLARDESGNIYVAQNGGIFGGHEGAQAGIQIISPDGTVDYLLTVTGAPNDLCFGPDGRLWFTDPRAPSDVFDPSTALPGRLYSCRPDGTDLVLQHEGLAFINGLAFTHDRDSLLLVETSRQRILDYRWRDGADPTPLITLDNGFPDGIALDIQGNVWVGATYDDSIRVYDSAGNLVARYETGKDSVPTNCCFGGPDLTSLYVAASGAGALVSLPTDVPGLPLLDQASTTGAPS